MDTSMDQGFPPALEAVAQGDARAAEFADMSLEDGSNGSGSAAWIL